MPVTATNMAGAGVGAGGGADVSFVASSQPAKTNKAANASIPNASLLFFIKHPLALNVRRLFIY
jgi:hypothetical protein